MQTAQPGHDVARRNILRLATIGTTAMAGVAAATGVASAAPSPTPGGPEAGAGPEAARGKPDRVVVDVRDHGAKGDGHTDDTAAIQRALDAGKGRTVYLPPGEYLVSTMLTVRTGTTVLATATSVVRRTAGPAIMGNGVLGDFTATKWDGESDIVVRGGVWDVNAGAVSESAAAFAFSHGHHIRFYDLTVRDVQRFHAIELNAVKNVRIGNCRFLGFSDPKGDRYYSEAVQMDYAGGPSHFGLFGAPDFYGCADVEVTGCYAGPSESFPSFPRLAGSHGGPDGHQHTGLRVIGNYAEGCTEWAIRVYDWTDALIEGNQIVNGGGGIEVGPAGAQTGGNIIVRGNSLHGLRGVKEAAGRPPDAAICVGRLNNQRISRVVIDGNVIGDTQIEGISVYRTDGAIVSGNHVTRCAGAGVRVESSPRAMVSGNTVEGPGKEGVLVRSGSDATLVTGNIVKDSGTYGVSVADAVTDVVVRDNVILGPGTTAGTPAGLGVEGGAKRASLVGNTVRRRGEGTEAAYGIAIAAGCEGTWYTGNDLRDAGPSGAVDDQGTGSQTEPGGPS